MLVVVLSLSRNPGKKPAQLGGLLVPPGWRRIFLASLSAPVWRLSTSPLFQVVEKK